MNIDKELQPLINIWIPLFDNNYKEKRIEVYKRPYLATIDFITHAISEITNSSKDEQMKPPWFGHWYKNAYHWYEENYGEALKKKGINTIKTFTIIDRIPYCVDIPNKKSEKQNNEESWLIIPNNVHDDEPVMSWIINKPTRTVIDKNDIENDIIKKTNLLRNIWVNLLITGFEEEKNDLYIKSIFDHITIFSDDIINNFHRGLTNSIWELNLAVEKAIKINLISKKAKFDYTHDVNKLYKIFLEMNKGVNDITITFLPSGKDAVKYRYAELIEKDLFNINLMYFESLEIINIALENIDKKIKAKNPKFLIRNPFYTGK